MKENVLEDVSLKEILFLQTLNHINEKQRKDFACGKCSVFKEFSLLLVARFLMWRNRRLINDRLCNIVNSLINSFDESLKKTWALILLCNPIFQLLNTSRRRRWRRQWCQYVNLNYMKIRRTLQSSYTPLLPHLFSCHSFYLNCEHFMQIWRWFHMKIPYGKIAVCSCKWGLVTCKK